MIPHNPIAAALDAVVLGPEVVFKNLVMVPLLRASSSTRLRHGYGGQAPQHPTPAAPFGTPQHLSAPLSTLNYLTLDDALSEGSVEITEVSEQGSVPELRVVNRGPNPVLIIDGEELLGAKQNRVVNLTILVAGDSELTIPVSCVEAGRWRARSHAFTSSPRTQYASGRAKRVQQVTYSMLHRGERMSDQSAVWADIAEKSARLQSASPTSAMEAMFSDHASSIDEFVEACHPADDQVGALFAIDGTIVGFDLFDRPATLRKILPKLVRSVAVDAIDTEPAGVVPPLLPHAERFLAVASAASRHAVKALGLGYDVRLSGASITGAALVADVTVVHLAAFNRAAAR